MAAIIHKTGPNERGEFLWRVCFKGQYYDSDPRMPGLEPVDEDFYVLATSQDQAISKVSEEIAEARKRCDKGKPEEITATIVTLENLRAARNTSGEGRMGYHVMSPIAEIALTCLDDKKRYRLGVCLVPIE